MVAPSITKNLFKLKKILKRKKTEDPTNLDVEAILNQIALDRNPEDVGSNPLDRIDLTNSGGITNPGQVRPVR